MITVVLSGGSGTRLWPLSRAMLPKQFIKLTDEKSLFQKTVERNQKFCSQFFIVCNEEHYFLAIDQLAEAGVDKASFILEPFGRNTAAAATFACMKAKEDDIVFIVSSDHNIYNLELYALAVEKAKKMAENGNIVLFGIRPTYPETGYGYIKSDGFDVVSFCEKPDKQTAEKFIEDGSYLWNSGMFCFRAKVFIEELQKHSPSIYAKCKEAFINKKFENSVSRILPKWMEQIPSDSIDYAVLEKSTIAKVVPCDFLWSDVGSFESLANFLPVDIHQNHTNTELFSVNSHNSFVWSKNKTVALIDVNEIMVIDTPDALLIAKKGSGQKVKDVVAKLKEAHSTLHETHLTVHRPWGTYTVLEEAKQYKIKSIVVKPGKRLSLQKHTHRSEHWVVVSGTAKVTLEEKIYYVCTNESTYIPMGKLHRLENQGDVDLVIIEAQVGEYLGEDDIIRIDDDYNRGI